MQDIELFIDWAVSVADSGRAVARNLNDGESRSFPDITSAVDYAAARSNTLSPRFPKGYRSRTVRLLESFEVTGLTALRGMKMETIVIDDTPPGESTESDSEPPECILRQAVRDSLRWALEARSEDEERGWMDRARDFEAQAVSLERRRAEMTQPEDDSSPRKRDPWTHVGGRNATQVAGFGYALKD